jgi:hypothetical protein
MRDADDPLHPSGLEAEPERSRATLGGEPLAPCGAIERPAHLRIVGCGGPIVVMRKPDPTDQVPAFALLRGPQPEPVLLPVVNEPEQLLPSLLQVQRSEISDYLPIGVDDRHTFRVTLTPAAKPKPRRENLGHFHRLRPMPEPSARHIPPGRLAPPARWGSPTTPPEARPRRTSPRRSRAAAGSRACAAPDPRG